MRTKIFCNLLLLAVSLLVLPQLALAQPVRQDTKFHAVPDAKLQIRAVEYDGSVNGTLKVEVKNTDTTAHAFIATGLYFVPQGDPNTAPQRLAAVGPMHQDGNERTQVDVPPGGTVVVALDVFCIDSHRGAPTTANRFDVGTSRMPAELSRDIGMNADHAVAETKSANPSAAASAVRPMAKSAIQSGVWEARDKAWKKLDGDGAQETERTAPPQQRVERMPTPAPK